MNSSLYDSPETFSLTKMLTLRAPSLIQSFAIPWLLDQVDWEAED